MNELLRVTFYRKNKGPCLVTISSVRVSSELKLRKEIWLVPSQWYQIPFYSMTSAFGKRDLIALEPYRH